MLVRLKRNLFRQSFQQETMNQQEEVLETATEFPSTNIFERSNSIDGMEIQQAKPPINQIVRLQKQVATTFCNISVKLVPLEKSIQVHPLVKEMFPEELKQNVPLGGTTSHFFQSWKAHKGSGSFRNSEWIQNPLVKDTSPGKSHLNSPLKKLEISSGKKDQRNVGEVSNKESFATQISACSKSISEQSFSCKKKR